MAALNLHSSTYKRFTITKKAQGEIENFYLQMAKKAEQTAKKLDGTTWSSTLQAQQYEKLAEELKKQATEVGQYVKGTVQSSAQEAADAVWGDATEGFLGSFGFDLDKSYMNAPPDIIGSLLQGKVYKSDWSLASSIWGDTKKTQHDIETIVAQGVALNKSAYDIARDLEKYVNPSARKDWDWSKVYPGTKRQVDYNAQRLARTMVAHAYQQSLERACAKNPFVDGYVWLASNSSRVCPICADRNGKFFKKGELPLDHPNGMCTFEAAISKSMNEIADDLAAWAKGESSNKALDAWYADITGNKGKPAFSDLQNQWLKPLGYSPDKMPANFTEFAKQLTMDDTTKFLHLAGGSWSDAHPYQLMEKYYNQHLATVHAGVGLKSPSLSKMAAKAMTNSSGIPDYGDWIDIIRQQTEREMLDWEESVFKKLTREQIDGLKTYTGSAYQPINSWLRGDRKGELSERLMNAALNAEKGLNSVKTTKDYVLRRGTDFGDLAGFLPGDFYDNMRTLQSADLSAIKDMLEGSIGEYKGFTSTSSMWDRGFSGSVEMIFYAPKGTSASSIMSISEFGTSEGETLLNAGTKVKIIRIERGTGHMGSTMQVFAEIIS